MIFAISELWDGAVHRTSALYTSKLCGVQRGDPKFCI